MTHTRRTVACTGTLLEDATGGGRRFDLLIHTADHRHFFIAGCNLDDSPAVVAVNVDTVDEIDDLLGMRQTPYRLASIEQPTNESAAIRRSG
jgi:hypothetical protein